MHKTLVQKLGKYIKLMNKPKLLFSTIDYKLSLVTRQFNYATHNQQFAKFELKLITHSKKPPRPKPPPLLKPELAELELILAEKSPTEKDADWL